MGAVVTEDLEPNCLSTIYASLRADGSTQARLFYDAYIIFKHQLSWFEN